MGQPSAIGSTGRAKIAESGTFCSAFITSLQRFTLTGIDAETLGFGPTDVPLPSGSFPFPLRVSSEGGDGSGRVDVGGEGAGLGAFNLSVTPEPLRCGWEGAGEGVDGPPAVEPSRGDGRFFRGAALANMSSSEKIASEVFFRFSPLLSRETPFVLSLTETLGSSFTAGFGGCGGLEGVDSTGSFLGLAGVSAFVPLTRPLSCDPPPIFSLIVGRVPGVGVDLLPGIDIDCGFETGSLSLAVFIAGVTGGGGGGIEG